MFSSYNPFKRNPTPNSGPIVRTTTNLNQLNNRLNGRMTPEQGNLDAAKRHQARLNDDAMKKELGRGTGGRGKRTRGRSKKRKRRSVRRSVRKRR